MVSAIFAGILLCAIGGGNTAGFFMNGYNIIANANGFRSGTANSGEVTEWPVDRGCAFTVKVALALTRRLAWPEQRSTAITRPITFLFPFSKVTFTGF